MDWLVTGKVIMLAPLDWGLGHATRCIPLIEKLSQHNRVILGVTDVNRFFFEKKFPHLTTITVPTYAIRYSHWLPVWFKLLLQAPRVLRARKREHTQLESLIKTQTVDLIISDSRFGFFHPAVKSVYITHQLHMESPFLKSWLNAIHRRWIEHFDEIWIPDFESDNLALAGKLSRANEIKKQVYYLGPLSALSNQIASNSKPLEFDILFLLSGPEPQRSILEKKLRLAGRHSGKRIALVRGVGNSGWRDEDGIKVVDILVGEELRRTIQAANTIVCRSGYSTLMDLHLLGVQNIVLIPTPGQSEQEYLAGYWQEKFGAVCVQQKDIEKFIKKW